MPEKIRMKVLQFIAPDGLNPRTYDVGEVYEVGTAAMPPEIAAALLEDGRAELVGKSAKVEEAPKEEKPATPKIMPRRPGPQEIK
jgi:hypothetical protein